MWVGDYIMPSKSALQIFLEQLAQTAVTEARKTFPLGSYNINNNTFDPSQGRFQYIPEQQNYPQNGVRLADASTLVRNEDVRNLPGLYKDRQERRSLEALLYQSRKELAFERLPRTQDLYPFMGLEAIDEVGTSQDHELLALQKRLQLSKEEMAGNCGEMVDFVYNYILTKYHGYPLNYIRPERLSLYRTNVIGGNGHDTNIDHVCVAIGRTRGNDNWRTWNDETIIIDAWIGRWFYRSQLRIENPWPFHVPTQDIRFKFV